MAEKPTPLKPNRTISQRLRHRRRDWTWRRRLKDEARLPDAPGREDKDFPGLAVYAIAILPKYHDWCLSMIDSLRKRGNYHGPVYVVTENPKPFEGLDNVQTIVVPYTRYRLVTKSCKQLILDWVGEKTLLYIDADIIIGKPLFEWYQRARPKLALKPLVLYTGNMPVAGAYHAGLMLMDRARVRPFFDRWLRLIRTGRYQLDQWSMHSIITEDDVARFEDEELIYLHQILGPDRANFDPSEHRAMTPPGTFIHVTNGLMRRYSADEIKAYLSHVAGLERIPESFGREPSQPGTTAQAKEQ
ncbi:hypothetical protein J7355_06140 [Endozoicomonas sp. G2_2]|uniref:hypothetical protein n=1 Tax=Endozoicomonas sp. G2_2 TaxID=2821092 RepID=UPI001ADB1C31|nr:hypothetical protein [Endozoicomonas sp. G2_2]MBO9469672.1 hypothetical protein [Endozoicomonas sp. G2_2]